MFDTFVSPHISVVFPLWSLSSSHSVPQDKQELFSCWTTTLRNQTLEYIVKRLAVNNLFAVLTCSKVLLRNITSSDSLVNVCSCAIKEVSRTVTGYWPFYLSVQQCCWPGVISQKLPIPNIQTVSSKCEYVFPMQKVKYANF